MNHAGVQRESDRLPWLNDTPAPNRAGRSGWVQLLLLVGVGALSLALLSFFLGRSSVVQQGSSVPAAPAEVTVSLPQPAEEGTAPAVAPEPSSTERAPETAPAPAIVRVERVVIERVPVPAPVSVSTSAPERSADEGNAAPEPVQTVEVAAPPVIAPAPRPPLVQPQPWPAAVSSGAEGRVARIGTFTTRHRAKVAWNRIVLLYPGVRRLRAVVAPVTSLRNGRTYYRLQFGTTSQAHSEVLCQRMRIVGQSCVVVGV